MMVVVMVWGVEGGAVCEVCMGWDGGRVEKGTRCHRRDAATQAVAATRADAVIPLQALHNIQIPPLQPLEARTP